MNDTTQTSDQLQGLPMSHLIGGPLSAVCEGQAQLARTTQEYIQDVGMTGDNQLRMIEFSFDRPLEHTNADGSVDVKLQQYKVQVPFIAIVSVPNLQVEQADINFTMELKSSHYVQRKPSPAPMNSQAEQPSSGPSTKRTVLTGSVTSSNHSRNSATLDIRIQARQQGMPEGLSRVMDMLHKSIVPLEVGQPRPLEQDSKG
ncbi:DUF2589 domain-containing protein [Ferrimonas sp. SCSIO 43195]|uniref:DUF2589 domain-containing protein n=1 Tax=Ferrimonas sp. SCSIO 43195 TaxID=2822844 RepID=UPI002075307B|nr:DUF2589 domain-containing protein [Ferrimonas sp. SCSIO 43195]USD36025.1 DUF2589 domain-containing protein [Ferrimonas sp. SCSIO 43195]